MTSAIGYVELIRAGTQLVSCGALDAALETFHTAHITFAACPNSVAEHWRTSSSILERAAHILQHSSCTKDAVTDTPDLYEEAACDTGPSVIRKTVVPSRTAQDNPILAESIILYNKALVYHLKQNVVAAEPLYETSRCLVESLLRMVAQDEYPTALVEVAVRCLNNLGALRYRVHGDEGARKLFRSATQLAQSQPDRLEYATVLSNMCRHELLRDKAATANNYDQLRRDLSTVLEIRQYVYGDTHYQVAATRHNLAHVLIAQQRRKQKQSSCQQTPAALDLLKSYLNNANSHSPRKLNPIPAVLKMILAEPLTKSTRTATPSSTSALLAVVHQLQEQRWSLGPDHTQLCTLLGEVGTHLFYHHKFRFALLLFQEELRIQQLHNEGNPSIATHNNIGRIYQELGQWDDAVRHYQFVLASDPSAPQTLDDIPTTASNNSSPTAKLSSPEQQLNASLYSTVWYNLGVIQDKRGARLDAIHSFQMSVRLRKIILGEEHADIACLYFNIGVLQIEQGCLDDAAVSLYEATRIRTHMHTLQHGQLSDQQMIQTLNSLSQHLKSRGNLTKALETYHQSLAVVESSTEFKDETSRHQELGSILRVIAELLSEIGSNESALEYSMSSVERLIAAKDQRKGRELLEHTEHLVSSLLLLGSLYHELCEPIQAVRVLAHAAEVVKQTVSKVEMELFPTPKSWLALTEVTTMLKLYHCAPAA